MKLILYLKNEDARVIERCKSVRTLPNQSLSIVYFLSDDLTKVDEVFTKEQYVCFTVNTTKK